MEHVILRYSRYDVQRELMRNKLKEMEVQDMTLKGLLSTQYRAQTRILMDFLRDIGVVNKV